MCKVDSGAPNQCRERLDSRGRSCLEWLEMGTWQEERNCRASIRYVCRNRNDHNSLADQSPLGQKLTDRACGTVVAAFEIVGCRNETDMPIFKRIAVEKAADFRTANREQRLMMMQSEEFVQLLPKHGQPADHNGEKPRKERFARSAHHCRALRKHEYSASDQRLNGYYPNSPVGCQGKATLEMR